MRTQFIRGTGGCTMTDMMINCFIAAMDKLNFTTAAESVHITQPAFSRNIVQMEEEIGFSLFLRSKKNGLRATAAGVEFYRGLLNMKMEYNNLVQRAKSIDRGEIGELVIGVVTGSCVDSKTMVSIKKFQEKYPKIRIIPRCYSVSSLIEAVKRGDCDLCFMVSSAVKGHDNLLAEDVFEIDNYVFVPRSAVIEEKEEYELWDFREQTFILSEDVPEINSLITSLCRQAGFIPKTVTAPDYETKMLWCEMGLGLAINSEDHYMKNSTTVRLVKVKEIVPDGYSVIWNKGNYNPGIALFYSMFCELMSS